MRMLGKERQALPRPTERWHASVDRAPSSSPLPSPVTPCKARASRLARVLSRLETPRQSPGLNSSEEAESRIGRKHVAHVACRSGGAMAGAQVWVPLSFAHPEAARDHRRKDAVPSEKSMRTSFVGDVRARWEARWEGASRLLFRLVLVPVQPCSCLSECSSRWQKKGSAIASRCRHRS